MQEMTISKRCRLLLGTTGKTDLSTRSGLYMIKSLHVADGGEVTALPEFGAQKLEFEIGNLHIFGGGTLHSIQMDIVVSNMTVDDLGILRGDSYDARYGFLLSWLRLLHQNSTEIKSFYYN